MNLFSIDTNNSITAKWAIPCRIVGFDLKLTRLSKRSFYDFNPVYDGNRWNTTTTYTRIPMNNMREATLLRTLMVSPDMRSIPERTSLNIPIEGVLVDWCRFLNPYNVRTDFCFDDLMVWQLDDRVDGCFRPDSPSANCIASSYKLDDGSGAVASFECRGGWNSYQESLREAPFCPAHGD